MGSALLPSMRYARFLAPLVMVVAIIGCVAPATAPGAGETPDTTRPTIGLTPMETVPGDEGDAVTGEVPDRILADILADASDRSGVAEDAISVTRAESVTWSDGSLGCPERGETYTQAPVDGFHIVLDADGEQLDYRVGAGGGFKLCEGLRPGG